MAFPGTYNFNYYRGDTFQFIIRPKDGNGDTYPLDAYSVPPAGATFTIASARGDDAEFTYTGTATVNPVDDIVTCVISAGTGRNLTPERTWYYDVQINDSSSTNVFTLLTGTITVTDDITGAGV
jgi:hypothetical protein